MNEWYLVGERLNSHRSVIAKAIANRDEEVLHDELEWQTKSGVTHLDVNATASKNEADDLEWMVETLLEELPPNIGLVLDTPNPDAAARALQALGRRAGTILNGISGDETKHAEMLRLARTYDTGVVAVLAAPQVPPRSADERMTLAEQLRAKLDEAAIPEEKQFFDPQILPAAYDVQQPRAALDCARLLRARWPKARIVAGLSNVSFNLPNRALMNRTLMTMLLASGADTLLCDPSAPGFSDTYSAARALLARDDFFTDYISKFTN